MKHKDCTAGSNPAGPRTDLRIVAWLRHLLALLTITFLSASLVPSKLMADGGLLSLFQRAKEVPGYEETETVVPEPPARGEVILDFTPLTKLRNTEMTSWFGETSAMTYVGLSDNMWPSLLRSTLPSTTGNNYPAPSGLEEERARGNYVPRELSTYFKEYLSKRFGVVAVPAAATRLLDDPAICDKPISDDGKLPPCASNSELERLMKFAKSKSEKAVTGPKYDAYIAVEALGLTWDSIDVVVERVGTKDVDGKAVPIYQVRPRHFDAEVSVCHGPIKLDVPSYKLYADLVRMPDSALIARITERRAPDGAGLVKTVPVRWKPVTIKTIAKSLAVEKGAVKIKQVVGWEARSPDAIVCEDILEHYADIRRSIDDRASQNQRSVLAEMFDKAFKEALASIQIESPSRLATFQVP